MSFEEVLAGFPSLSRDATSDTTSSALLRIIVITNSLGGRYQSNVLRGIRTTLRGKANLFVSVTQNIQHVSEFLESLQDILPGDDLVDGVIMLSGAIGLDEEGLTQITTYFERKIHRKIPVVSVGVTALNVPAIIVDDKSGIRMAVRHLVRDHKFERIGFLCGPSNNSQAIERFDAFQDTLGSKLYDENYVIRDGDFSLRWGHKKTLHLLGIWPNIQAILAANDEMARGALRAIEEMRLEKRRPAVIGFDDTEYAAAISPKLTTVRQPLEEQGRWAANTILQLCESGFVNKQTVTLPTVLQIRESCGCAPLPDVTHRPSRRQLTTWVSRLIPDRNRASSWTRNLLRLRKQVSWECYYDQLVADTTSLLKERLQMATRSDIGVWQYALFRLRSSSHFLLSTDDGRWSTLDSFWVNLLERVAETGAELALQADDLSTHIAELQNDLEANVSGTQRASALRRMFAQLGTSEYYLRVDDATSEPNTVLRVVAKPRQDLGEDSQQCESAAKRSDAFVIYRIKSTVVAGYFAIELGLPANWWTYSEIARMIAHAYDSIVLEGVVSADDSPATRRHYSSVTPAADDAHLKRITSLPPAIRTLKDCKRQADEELDKLQSQLPFTSASVQLISGDARSLFLSRGFPENSVNRSLLRPISIDPLVSRIIESREPLFRTNIQDDPDWNVSNSEALDIKSWIGAPIFDGGQPIGFLTLDFRDQVSNLDGYRPVVEHFTQLVAPVLERASPLMGEQQMNAVMSIVSKTIDIIAEKLDPKELLQVIVDHVAQHLHCSHCTLFLPMGRNEHFVLEAEYSSSPNTVKGRTFGKREGIAGWVFEEGRPVVLPDAHLDKRFAPTRQQTDTARSMLVVPIKVGDQTIGVISADQDQYGWFHPSDIRLVEALAQQAGIAIQRSQAIRFLQDIAATILSLEDPRKILQTVVERAIRLMNANAGIIYHLTDDKRSVRDSYHYPLEDEHPSPRLSLTDGLTRSIIDSRTFIWISDIASDARVNPLLHGRYKSIIGVPLTIDEDVIGVLYVNDVDQHVFAESEISLLETLASQAAIALQKATLLDARNREIERYRSLELQLERLHKIVEASDLARVMDAVGEGILTILGSDVSSTVNLFSEETGTFGQCHVYGPLADRIRTAPRDNGVGRYVLRTRQPVYHADVNCPPLGSPTIRPESSTLGIKSFAAVPLQLGERLVGVLYINSQIQLNFAPDECRMLELFASHVAIAIVNTSLYEQIQARYKSVSAAAARRISGRMKDYAGIEFALMTECRSFMPDKDNIGTIQERLKATTANLKRLIWDFERYGERIRILPRATTWAALLSSAIEPCRNELSKEQIDLEILSPDEGTQVVLDPDQISKCVQQLLTNARRVLVSSMSATNRTNGKVRIFCNVQSNWAVLRVEDDGPGFPPNVPVEQPFVSTDPDHTGVGLAIVKEIVLAHGGEMTLGKSETLSGALVELRIPRMCE